MQFSTGLPPLLFFKNDSLLHQNIKHKIGDSSIRKFIYASTTIAIQILSLIVRRIFSFYPYSAIQILLGDCNIQSPGEQTEATQIVMRIEIKICTKSQFRKVLYLGFRPNHGVTMGLTQDLDQMKVQTGHKFRFFIIDLEVQTFIQ